MSLSEWLRDEVEDRIDRGVSAVELVRKSPGLTPYTLSRFRHGRSVSLRSLEQISSACGLIFPLTHDPERN